MAFTWNISKYLSAAWAGHLFLGAPWTPPTDLYMAVLPTFSDYDETYTEPATADGYARRGGLTGASVAVGLFDSATRGGGNLILVGYVTDPADLLAGQGFRIKAATTLMDLSLAFPSSGVADGLLNLTLRRVPYTPPSSWYMGHGSIDPVTHIYTEASYSGYARQPITWEAFDGYARISLLIYGASGAANTPLAFPAPPATYTPNALAIHTSPTGGSPAFRPVSRILDTYMSETIYAFGGQRLAVPHQWAQAVFN
jgi:hypothetical protein